MQPIHQHSHLIIKLCACRRRLPVDARAISCLARLLTLNTTDGCLATSGALLVSSHDDDDYNKKS